MLGSEFKGSGAGEQSQALSGRDTLLGAADEFTQGRAIGHVHAPRGRVGGIMDGAFRSASTATSNSSSRTRTRTGPDNWVSLHGTAERIATRTSRTLALEKETSAAVEVLPIPALRVKVLQVIDDPSRNWGRCHWLDRRHRQRS
jgi:hypothetical protein